MRAIARDADVSAALVVHHFGSKQGLREVIDDHVLGMIREGKLAAMTGGFVLSADEYAELAMHNLDVMAYLARSLTEGDELGHALYTRLHADAVDYLAAGVEAGVLQPSDDPQAQAGVLLNLGLSHVLLASHLQRVLGLGDEVEIATRTAPVMLDLYTDGLFTDDRFRAAWRGESTHASAMADPDPPSPDPTSTPD